MDGVVVVVLGKEAMAGMRVPPILNGKICWDCFAFDDEPSNG